MQSVIANPRGIYLDVDDFTTGRDSAGIPIPLPKRVERYRANADVSKGTALMFVAPTTTVPLSVTAMTTAVGASDPWRFAGVALADADAGYEVDVCVEGFCEVLFDSASTAAAYSLLQLPATTDGEFDIIADPADNGEYAGVCYGAEISTSDRCFAQIGRPLVRFEAGA